MFISKLIDLMPLMTGPQKVGVAPHAEYSEHSGVTQPPTEIQAH
jgi:hypothetical protein